MLDASFSISSEEMSGGSMFSGVANSLTKLEKIETEMLQWLPFGAYIRQKTLYILYN